MNHDSSFSWHNKYLLVGLVFILFLFVTFRLSTAAQKVIPTSTPTPVPTVFVPHIPKQAAKKDAYTVLLIGDSMTQALGPNTDELRKDLKKYYPNTVFGIFNYGQGSTNILSVEKVLKDGNSVEGMNNPSVLGREFELVIIESFGNNPLSQYSTDEGLKVQTKELDKIVSQINSTHPKAVIAFLATIAPNTKLYAKNTAHLTPEQSKQWATERIAYIKNHMEYAKNHDIYLIDVFDKSLDKTGDGDLKYISSFDFIHPSEDGVRLISQEIADFVYNNKILLP